ncbi:hypothetical protein F2P81_011841 [Scophthalmus maximus]|uniref:Mitochondrial carrier-like 1 n=1 Tax=Scophthalmus maximus TaxID=52904 RepID=A0A6A4SV29_SCOMX|nr:hypothetical protein F2P81_011841 [Scophthalmus maximus]
MLGSAGFDHGATNDSDAVLRPRRVKKMDPPEPGAEQEAPAAPVDVDVDAAVLLLGAGVTAATHPLLYVKLLIQLGHEPLPPTVGTTMFRRRVLYLPGFFSYVHHIVEVDGKRGLLRGLSPCLVSSAISTVVRSKQVEHLFKRDDLQTSLRKVVKETSHEMIIQCLSRVATHPLHVMSVRCMAQFVGREVKYSQASAVRSYTKFVMGVAVSVLTYPFMLVADLMAVNNCGLAAGLPPRSPVFKSWLRCWNHLSLKFPGGCSLYSVMLPFTVVFKNGLIPGHPLDGPPVRELRCEGRQHNASMQERCIKSRRTKSSVCASLTTCDNMQSFVYLLPGDEEKPSDCAGAHGSSSLPQTGKHDELLGMRKKAQIRNRTELNDIFSKVTIIKHLTIIFLKVKTISKIYS